MKLHVYIGVVLMAMMVGCKSPTTSPLPSSVGEREVYQTLVGIDSLMWRQPDNALAVMMEFAGSSKADSMDVFEEHYCQMLIAELLFKNNYDQTNREALQQAVAYFDSLVRLAPPLKGGRGDSKHTFSQNDNLIFLAARAHYINGAGYYERDSLIEACGEYLCALRMMEGHFAKNELVGTKARFMTLTHNRLEEIFSAQFMQEPAIYCGKQALVYNEIAPTSPYGSSKILYRIGKQYDKLNVADSASYYFSSTSIV